MVDDDHLAVAPNGVRNLCRFVLSLASVEAAFHLHCLLWVGVVHLGSLGSYAVMFSWYRQPVIQECGNISLNRLLDIGNRFLSRSPLADTADQAGAFSDPETVFSRIKQYLSHYRPVWQNACIHRRLLAGSERRSYEKAQKG